jgi:glycosyltransferase involved in cell wall biosynthesis
VPASRRLRVVHYIGTWTSGTGVDTFVLHLAAAQRELGVDAYIGCDEDKREEFLASARAQGFPYFLFQKPGKREPALLPSKLKTALNLARRIAGLVRFIVQNRIDILHLHSVALSSIEAHLVAALTRRPIVVTHHATIAYIRPDWSKMTELILGLEKARSRHVCCPYERAADELRELGMKDEQLLVVPFCADERKFKGSIDIPKAGEEFRLLTVSRLVEGKGHLELLEGLAKVRTKLPNVRLSIIGDGPTRANIERAVARLGLGDIVTLTGHVHNSVVPELMRQAHVVVLPSYMQGETYPVCLLEAMCLGMPCIGTRWVGIPDIITDGETGFVVEPKDADGLARAIEGLAGDLDFFARASANAARRAHAEFTGAAVAGRYRQMYDQVVKV